jgi:hypothetical protein
MYSDHLQWLRISDRVYSYSIASHKFFDLRMVCLRLESNDLLIYSPLPSMTDEGFESLNRLGRVTAIVEPNHFHNLGVSLFTSKYPEAKLYCSRQAKARLEKVTRQGFSDIALLKQHMPSGWEFIVPDGLKTGETWLMGNGTLLIVCDSFFNMPTIKAGLFGWVIRLTGGGPGLRISNVFRLIAQRNRGVYRSSVETILGKFKPTTLVPSHGEILSDLNLSRRLLDLI